uniref:Uncharacterized protein n=1 Tax=Eucampia antarctica TaxID=49252 RepID=A0A7S2S9P0_9STRA
MDLPTIMIQLLTSFSKNKYVDPDETPGMVGTELDPNSPYDVLLAIPPQHYTEYIPEDDKFRIRLSIRNSGGSVIGANALQGRHLNFDLISPRIGIAETTKCAVGKKDKPKIPNTPPPVPTIAPTSYMDIQVDFDDIFSSTPSMQPSSKASLLSGTSHSELAIIFSDNSFSYGYFYFIGFGVVGVTLVLVVFMSLVSSPDDQQRFNGEKESLVRTSQPLPIHASFRHMKNRATRGLQRKPTYSKQGNGVRHQRAESPRDYDF